MTRLIRIIYLVIGADWYIFKVWFLDFGLLVFGAAQLIPF